MTLIVATLLSFIILGCIASTKSLIAIVGLAALFYVSLPAFVFLMMVMGIIYLK